MQALLPTSAFRPGVNFANRPVADVGSGCDDCQMISLPVSVAVAIAASFSTQTLPPQQLGTDHVTITEVSADPRFPSGVLATAVRVSGTVGNEQRFYFIPFMTIGQAKPRVGNRCAISWRWHSGFQWLLGDGGSFREGRRVTNFHCEPGAH